MHTLWLKQHCTSTVSQHFLRRLFFACLPPPLNCFLWGYVWGVFLIPSKVPGNSIHSIMLVHYQINQWPAGLPGFSVLKCEPSWEPGPLVPMETGCCISLNVEHLKTGLCGRSPGMQDDEWLTSVREISLRVQTHTPLASGPEQLGDANRCWKNSMARLSSFTKMCFLLLFYRPAKNESIFSITLTLDPSHWTKSFSSLWDLQEKGDKMGRQTALITLYALDIEGVCVRVCVSLCSLGLLWQSTVNSQLTGIPAG